VDARPEEATALANATKILVIRHGEKPSEDSPAVGVTADGVVDPASLTVQGWQRAGALVPLLAPAVGLPRPGLALPQKLYGSSSAADGSARPVQTIIPLSARLNLPVETTYTKGQETDLVVAVKTRPGVVLICWQHERISDIANAILGNQSAPQHWPKERFDVIWLFDRDGSSGQYTFSQIPQQLLAGDLATGI
jgi:broad specificity phosphatase PhoE